MPITSSQTRAVIEAAEMQAAELGVRVNVAVLDAGVHLKSFSRMDGAVLGSIDIAMRKARTAALFGIPSEAVWEYCKPDAPAHHLELTNGGLAPFPGGLPLRDETGELLGAVGVSGGTVAQDQSVAEAGARAFTGPPHAPSAPDPRNRAAVEAAFRAWGDGTGSPFELLEDDAIWTIVGRSVVAGSYQGREAFLREVIRPFQARMREPLRPSIRRIYVDASTVIVFFDAAATARDGKPYTNTYAWFLEMRDGRIVAASAFFDTKAFDELWSRVPVDAPQRARASSRVEPG